MADSTPEEEPTNLGQVPLDEIPTSADANENTPSPPETEERKEEEQPQVATETQCCFQLAGVADKVEKEEKEEKHHQETKKKKNIKSGKHKFETEHRIRRIWATSRYIGKWKMAHKEGYQLSLLTKLPVNIIFLMESEVLHVLKDVLKEYKSQIGSQHPLTFQVQDRINALKLKVEAKSIIESKVKGAPSETPVKPTKFSIFRTVPSHAS
nr:PREDICTED: testis-expressed sequence 40 protein-like isoform X3 [Latimeria chalumnae]|eukprot:XP_014339324.1 PREDICTED: testis-expressed sequence 40 protein-like isoform X3 [Latimeria chalumnae]